MTTILRENCACGASTEVVLAHERDYNSAKSAHDALATWRLEHQHDARPARPARPVVRIPLARRRA